MAPPEPHASLARPSTAAVVPHRSVHPRRLAALEPPPVTLGNYPLLPHSRNGYFFADFHVQTHVFPAAFPRCPSGIWSPPPLRESPEERKRRIHEVVALSSALKEAQEQSRDSRVPLRQVYWTVANRYFRRSCPTTSGLTLVFLHGIGGHKEVRLKRYVHSTTHLISTRHGSRR